MLTAISKSKIAFGIAILAGAGGIWFLTATFWKVSHTVRDAEARVAQAGLVPFHEVALDRPIPQGVESISTPSQFRDAAFFRGRFYLCGPGGLRAYDANGSLQASYRPGLELPPAPLVRS